MPNLKSKQKWNRSINFTAWITIYLNECFCPTRNVAFPSLGMNFCNRKLDFYNWNGSRNLILTRESLSIFLNKKSKKMVNNRISRTGTQKQRSFPNSRYSWTVKNFPNGQKLVMVVAVQMDCLLVELVSIVKINPAI